MRTSWLSKYLIVSVDENGYLSMSEKIKICFVLRPSVADSIALFFPALEVILP